MNFFGAFTFGRLIKTYLPGFVILIGCCLLLDALLVTVLGKATWLQWAVSSPVFSGIASIPLSLICGVFSNIVFFTYLTGLLVKKPFQAANPDFEAKQTKILRHLVTEIGAAELGPETFADLDGWLDPEFLLMPRVPLDRYVFLQESYWYYLEFQLNLILAWTVLSVGGTFWVFAYAPYTGLSAWTCLAFLAGWAALGIGIVRLCLKAARVNYDRHRKKLLSLLVGSFIEGQIHARLVPWQVPTEPSEARCEPSEDEAVPLLP